MLEIALFVLVGIYLQIWIVRDKKRYKAWIAEQRRMERKRRKQEESEGLWWLYLFALANFPEAE